MQNSPFLTIVIPVYNGAKVVSRCLDSIWTQGLDDLSYEVICVNDCSTDDTESVLKHIQYSHSNLHVLNNFVNKRAGGSRNYGVREAKGRYIVFIDSDDYFHPFALKQVIEILHVNDLDILMCDFARETEFQKNNNIFLKFPNHMILTGRDFLLLNGCPFGPCKYIFKRNLMVEQSIFFEENVCCEDVDWVHKITLAADSIQYRPILLSHVVINDLSQTANEHKMLKTVSDKFFAGYRMNQLAEYFRDDVDVYKKLEAVSAVYYKQGVKYFTAIYADVYEKKSVLEKYFPYKLTMLPKIVKLALKLPLVYSMLTNITAPLICFIIKEKRKIKGR